jgi:hypothetical protein
MWACDPAVTANVVNSYQAVGPVFAQALQTFLAAQCAIAGDHLWPADATEAVLKGKPCSTQSYGEIRNNIAHALSPKG